MLEGRDEERRLRFLTAHLHDLQSIRWAPLNLFLLAAPYAGDVGDGRVEVFSVLIAVASALWYWGSTRFLRERFGRCELSLQEILRQHSLNRFFGVILIVFSGFELVFGIHSQSIGMDIMLGALSGSLFLGTILDETNLTVRRTAYGAAAAALAGGMPLLFRSGRGRDGLALAGLVFLSLEVCDVTLLSRLTREGRQEEADA